MFKEFISKVEDFFSVGERPAMVILFSWATSYIVGLIYLFVCSCMGEDISVYGVLLKPAIFPILGLLLLALLMGLLKTENEWFLAIGSLVLAIVALIATINIFGTPAPRKSEYSDVFQKDPNTWTESEKKHVDNFFEWLD